MNVLENLKDHIEGHMNHISREELDKKTPIELLRLCHPTYRPDYARMLFKNDDISLLEVRQFTTKL